MEYHADAKPYRLRSDESKVGGKRDKENAGNEIGYPPFLFFSIIIVEHGGK